jgi:hypothetical protein
MREALSKSSHPTLWDSPNVTSSGVAGSGVSPCDKPDGQTPENAGQEVVPARVFPQREKEKGLQTLVTSGRNGFGSSASAALQRSLENKSRQLLDTAGSTLWEWTWKAKATPLRRRYFQRQVLERRTSETGSSSLLNSQKKVNRRQLHSELASWPTPNARLSGGGDYSDPEKAALRREQGHQVNLSEAVHIASWATPRTEDGESAGMRHSRGAADTLTAQSSLATWATPAERDYRTSNLKPWKERGGGNKGEQLPNQVKHLAAWPTPQAHDNKIRGNTEADCRYSPHDLSNMAEFASWVSPTATDAARGGAPSRAHDTKIPLTHQVVNVAAWPTCAASDGTAARGRSWE